MTTKITTRQDTKIALLEAGMEIMYEKGYTNTGIQEVLSSIGVPKGSFYHYFDSKEDFTLKIIEYSEQNHRAKFLRILRNANATPLVRLRNFCDDIKKMLEEGECRKGCLIGNLSQELADQNETLRQALDQVMNRLRDLLANCIAEGQKVGEITKTYSAPKLAEFFLNGWEGALMKAKLSKSTEPLDIFIEIMFKQVLKS
jgi:TetR/AcrR family transcriptional repressor of nem operon